jgi:hypothetical protein
MGVASERVLRLAELLLGETPPVPPVRMELGYGNENWHLQLSGGRQVLIKIAQPGHPVPKAESASRAQQLAHAVGAPVAQEILLDTQCAAADGRIVRILEYLPGLHPTHVLDSTASIDTFFGSLGRAVAHLHHARCEGFASHIGGAPSFPTWSQYVAYRVPQIARRGRACTLLTELTCLLCSTRLWSWRSMCRPWWSRGSRIEISTWTTCWPSQGALSALCSTSITPRRGIPSLTSSSFSGRCSRSIPAPPRPSGRPTQPPVRHYLCSTNDFASPRSSN